MYKFFGINQKKSLLCEAIFRVAWPVWASASGGPDGQRFPAGRQEGFAACKALGGDFQSAESEQHGLQHAACSRHEAGVVARRRLGEDPERRPQVRPIAAAEHLQRFVHHAKPRVLDGEYRVAHRRAVRRVDFRFVVAQVAQQRPAVGDDAQRPAQQIGVGLFDLLAVVVGVFARRPVGAGPSGRSRPSAG